MDGWMADWVDILREGRTDGRMDGYVGYGLLFWSRRWETEHFQRENETLYCRFLHQTFMTEEVFRCLDGSVIFLDFLFFFVSDFLLDQTFFKFDGTNCLV